METYTIGCQLLSHHKANLIILKQLMKKNCTKNVKKGFKYLTIKRKNY